MKTSKPELVTAALLDLGGDSSPVDTEDIAIRVDEMAPGVFVWRKYRDRIDKELVRVALADAKRKLGYVTGAHRSSGWMLTAAGVSFAQSVSLDGLQETATPRSDPSLDRERARLLASDALAEVRKGGGEAVSEDMADSFFRLSVYVTGSVREKKILRIENAFGADPDLGDAVSALAAIARRRV